MANNYEGLTRIKGKTFGHWKAEVNRKMVAKVGLDCDSIADWGYYDAWMAGMAPATAASKALTAARNS